MSLFANLHAIWQGFAEPLPSPKPPKKPHRLTQPFTVCSSGPFQIEVGTRTVSMVTDGDTSDKYVVNFFRITTPHSHPAMAVFSVNALSEARLLYVVPMAEGGEALGRAVVQVMLSQPIEDMDRWEKAVSDHAIESDLARTRREGGP